MSEGHREKPVVLAVDDTPENLDVVKGILTPEFTVRAATSGKMALKIIEKQQPDIILLDIMMPGMSGYDVCEQLKADPSTRDIPVIFLTAMEQTTDEAKGFELGAADYITKPVNPPILEARVRTHLALKFAMDELQSAYAVIKKQKDRMQEELNVGRDIQMSMLPIEFPPFPDRSEFDLHAILEPAREVGGADPAGDRLQRAVAGAQGKVRAAVAQHAETIFLAAFEAQLAGREAAVRGVLQGLEADRVGHAVCLARRLRPRRWTMSSQPSCTSLL